MTQAGSPSGWATGSSGLSARNGSTKARPSAIGRSTSGSPTEDLMITVQTNSQPPEGTDKIGDAISALYEIVRKPKAD